MKPTQLTLAQGRRLKAARKSAGFRSARAAAHEFEWPESTYRSHEAGTRTIGQNDADRYARAFRARGAVVSSQSILFGSTDEDIPISLGTVQKLFDELPAEMQAEALRFLEYLKTKRI